jgi:hypothetical protein
MLKKILVVSSLLLAFDVTVQPFNFSESSTILS